MSGESGSVMAILGEDVFRAARLLQWGLQPRVKPVQHVEYLELVREYINRADFREVVEEMSDGIGLYVLDVSEHGVVLSPREDSVFLLRSADFRPSSTRAEDRLLDGLVQVTIAATVFPRSRDLEDDIERPRPPVTIDEIEDQLRGLCDSLAILHRDDPDPKSHDLNEGLDEAWRVYQNRYAAKETKDRRRSKGSTRRIIEYGLDKLKDFGCFVECKVEKKRAWQPTRRYNVLVQELAASRLFSQVKRVLEGDEWLDEREEKEASQREERHARSREKARAEATELEDVPIFDDEDFDAEDDFDEEFDAEDDFDEAFDEEVSDDIEDDD